MPPSLHRCTPLLLSAFAAGFLGACSSGDLFGEAEPPAPANPIGDSLAIATTQNEGIGEGVGISVNSFLWRAALETVSVLPLNSEDPFGGVIETDWYRVPDDPNERIKMLVYILSRDLRSDSVRVELQREVRRLGGPWQRAAVDPQTAPALEAAILARAREMRIAMSRTP